MIISEKGLTAALKKAYKAGGYVLLNSADQAIIYTGNWYVRASWPKFPVKALATIVEQMGSLPTEEGALAIAKDTEPQHVMAEKVGEDIAYWAAQGAAINQAIIVPVVFMGARIFQTAAGACYGTTATPLGIVEPDVIETGAAKILDNDRMSWEAEDERVIIQAIRPTGGWEEGYEKTVWSHLEAIDLARPKE